MNDRNSDNIILVGFISLVLGFGVGTFSMGLIARLSFNNEAIRHHAAQYNDKTGQFEWLDMKEQ